MGLHPFTILQSHTLHQEYLTPGDKCILSIHSSLHWNTDFYTCNIICIARSITWYTYSVCVCVHMCVCVCMNSVWLPELLICFYLAFYHFIFLHVSWYVLSKHFHFSFPIIYLANLLYFLLSMKLKVNLSSCIKMSWNFY